MKASIWSGEPRATAQEVASHVNAVHVLVNTAGFTRPVPHGDLEALDDALIDSIFASNWRGVFATIRAFHPLLKESGDGLIVNVSSTAALTGVGSNIAYVASKAGLDVMGKALARALAPTVRVLTVARRRRIRVPGRGAATPRRRFDASSVGQPDGVAAAIEAAPPRFVRHRPDVRRRRRSL